MRIAYYLICLTLFVGFMWGLRTIMYAMGQDFALGVVFGMFLLGAVLWVHWKLTGKNIFTDA